jgi:CCR4-NOT transcription complex subunit 7/8
VVKPVGDFKTAGAYQYTTIRTNVDILKMIQLGLTFCNSKGELPSHNGELCVWQFNFREFDPENDMYAPESIKLLLDSGINFKTNASRGVDQVKFAELLMTSGVVLNADVSWITFHSGYDFGCAPSPLCCCRLIASSFSRSLEVDRVCRRWLLLCFCRAACLLPHPLATSAARSTSALQHLWG